MLAADARQQLIAEIIAQLMQRGTHPRLRHAQFLPGARDVLLAQQRIECNQQVEVESVELHDVLMIWNLTGPVGDSSKAGAIPAPATALSLERTCADRRAASGQ